MMNQQIVIVHSDDMCEPREQAMEMSHWEEAAFLDSAPIHSSTINEPIPPVEVQDSDDEIIIGAGIGGGSECLDDTIPINTEKRSRTVEVRREYALTELMAMFSDPALMELELDVRIKHQNGQLEPGHGSGVFRDCLSEFWSEFYSRCTLGADVRVPYLRHEYQIQEWQSIARILVKGWLAVGYFPGQLSLPFMEEALYGTTYSSIKDSFMHYVSKQDKEILEQALDSFQSVDQESLIETLDVHECHQIPTADNISALLSQLGHKALIQTPMFVIECWRPILKTLAETLTPQRLSDLVLKQVPTSKRVKDILMFPPEMNSTQNRVAKNLKRYIGEMTESDLKLFLRFCTGADLLLGKEITVTFTETSDFQCRPVALTCSCNLVIPVNYQNYPDLRADFDSILHSSVWVMDIG